MQNLEEMIQMNLFTKHKQTHRLKEWMYGYQREGWRAEIDWEFGIDCTYYHFKIDNQQAQGILLNIL